MGMDMSNHGVMYQSINQSISLTIKAMFCTICDEQFDELSHRPMILHCGRTFCSQCIDSFQSVNPPNNQMMRSSIRSDWISCPMCRTLINRSAAQLNRTLLDLINETKEANPAVNQSADPFDETEVTTDCCDYCTIDQTINHSTSPSVKQPAVNYCFDCSHWMCDLHTQLHARINHSVNQPIHQCHDVQIRSIAKQRLAEAITPSLDQIVDSVNEVKSNRVNSEADVHSLPLSNNNQSISRSNNQSRRTFQIQNQQQSHHPNNQSNSHVVNPSVNQSDHPPVPHPTFTSAFRHSVSSLFGGMKKARAIMKLALIDVRNPDIHSISQSVHQSIDVLIHHPNCHGVQTAGLRALSELFGLLVHNRSNTPAVEQPINHSINQSIPLIVDSMKLFPTYPELQLMGIMALSRLAMNQSINQSASQSINARLRDAGALSAIIKAMRSFSQSNNQSGYSVDIQAEGCKSINHLSMNQSINQSIDQTVIHNCITAVIKSMTTYPDSPIVQSAACAAIWSIDTNSVNQSDNQTFNQSIKQLKALSLAIKPIIEALNNQSINQSVNQSVILHADAIGALCSMLSHESLINQSVNLSVHRSSNSNSHSNYQAIDPSISQSIVDLGGIPAIINMMKHHNEQLKSESINQSANQSVMSVLANGCGCLCNLSDQSINRSLIIQHGGLDVILDSIKLSSDQSINQSAGVADSGCRAVSRLAVDVTTNESINQSINQSNGLAVIINVMKTFASSIDVQMNGCAALHNLSLNQSIKQSINQLNGVDVLHTARINHRDDVEMVTRAKSTIKRLSN